MNQPNHPFLIATCAALDLPSADVVPDWVHLLPAAQGEIRTFDGRGPYRVTDPAAIIAASMAGDPRDANGLIIDENHAVDLASGKGGPSPARGRITAMEARADGIWGRVKWNAAGSALLADQAYRGLSPVIAHTAAGEVTRILRASLVNYANLRGLTALNQETTMSFMALLAQKRGLKPDATEAEILASVPAIEGETALQSQLTAIGTALGVTGGDATAILAAAQARPAVGDADITAMQAELVTVTGRLAEVTTTLTALQAQAKREKAEAFVDAAIAAVRPSIKVRRAYYIARHMEDPAETEATINAIPSYGSAGHGNPRQAAITGTGANDLTAMNAEQQGRVLADRAVALQSEQKAKGITLSMSDAVTQVAKDVQL